MKKITFKEYVKSKRELVETVKTDQYRIIEYRISRYCAFVVNEHETLKFKPNDKINVKWEYIDNDFQFSILEQLGNTYLSKWTSKRIKKWIKTNTDQLL